MPLETVNIEGVEIFAVGKWNEDSYSPEDLQKIVNAYESTKGKYQPFLKLSHDDAQRLAKKSGFSVDEMPALGWMENLRLAGDKLIADFKNVPKKIAELMKVGAFRTRSAEIWKDIEFEAGVVFPYMLKAVGLLGADAPAVAGLNTLDDFIALYAEKAKVYQTTAEVKIYDLPAITEEAQQMEKVKELEAKLAESEKKHADEVASFKASAEAKEKEFATLNATVESLKATAEELKKQMSEAKAEAAKYAAEKRKIEIETKIDALVKSKKLAPAQKDFAIALLEKGMAASELQFKSGDKEFKTPEELLFGLIDAGTGVTLSTEVKTEAGKANREGDHNEVGIELDLDAKKYMEQHKVSYKEAYLAVSKGK